jgi:uncharacterized repeat protein (TIGR01451 family)
MVLLACSALRWHSAWARTEFPPGHGATTQSGISIMLAASQTGAGSYTRGAAQDAPTISVARDCPAALLDDGSVGVTATISSAIALSAVSVIDDAGAADNPADAIALTVQDGDQNGDGVLDPGESWTVSGAFTADASAAGDTITATGTDADGNTVSGGASCDALPDGAAAPAATPPITTNPEPTATVAEPNVTTDVHAAAVEPTVTIGKTGIPATVNAGEQVAFNITVGNEGPDSAFDVELNDTLPAGADLDWEIDRESTSANCDISGDVGAETLICTDTELSPGEHMVARVFATSTTGDCGTITNQAQVRWAPESGGEQGDWLSSESADIQVDCPAVVVEKVADQPTILAGEDAVFKMTVSNPTEDNNFAASLLTDELPTGIDWTIDDTSDCAITQGELACRFDGPAPQNSITVTLTGTTSASDCGRTIENTAEVAIAGSGFAPGSTGDFKMALAALTVGGVKPASTTLNQAGPSSTASITVQCTSVTIEKTATNSTINAGEDAVYTLTVHNDGSATAHNVQIEDTLPAGPDWQTPDGCSNDGSGTLTCSLADIAAGGDASITLQGATDAADCGTISNSASVSVSNETGGNSENNGSGAVDITIQCPEITIDKTAAVESVSPGDDVSFTITVNNNGDGSAHNVELSDALPAGQGGDLDWQIDTGATTADCTIDGTAGAQTLSCTETTLAAGGQVAVTVSATPTFSDCALIENQAQVRWALVEGGEPGDWLSSETASTDVDCPRFVVEKTADQDTIFAGQTAAFTLKVMNTVETDTSFDSHLHDDLPSGIDWQVDDTEDCSISEGALDCYFTGPAGGTTTTIHLTGATARSNCGQVIENSASVEEDYYSDYSAAQHTAYKLIPLAFVAGSRETSTEALNEFGQSSSASITVQCTDVTITKEAQNATISAGDDAVYTLTVHNNGSVTAHNVTVSDDLPTGPDWQTPDNCEAEGNTLGCSLPDINPNGTASITITGTTGPSACGKITNSASVSISNESGGDSEDNDSGSVDITIQCADLTLAKAADPTTISAGDTAKFVLTIGNDGPGDAVDISLYDPLPGDLTWTPDDSSCSTADDTLNCHYDRLAPGATKVVTLTAPTNPADCGTITNTGANVYSPNEDERLLDNNDASASITINCADLTLQKAADPASISAGDTATFRLTVGNDGLGDAVDVTLTDPLPEGFVWTPDDPNCAIDSGTLTCHYDRLAPESTTVITLTAPTSTADCGSVANNDASVASPNEPEGATDNNSGSATITVSCPDLRLTKEAMAEHVTLGDPVVFTILVTNSGAGVARAATLTDNLPDGIDWSADGAGCSIAPDTGTTGQVLTCDFGDMEPEAAETVVISGGTTAANCGAVANSASVAATNEADDAKANNTDNASTTVVCPRLSITKTAADADIAPGDTASYTIAVTNDGDGPARTLTVTDDLPGGITWTMPTPTDGCTITEGALHCTAASLAAGATFSVTVSGAIPATTCGPLAPNTATAVADNADAVTSAPVTVTVTCPAGLVVTKTVDADEVAAGVDIGFTATVTNNGLGAANGVTLTDDLPANVGLAWSIDTDQSDAGCQIADGTLTCDFGTIEATGSRSVHIVSPTTDASCGTVSNTVTAAATNEPDADPANLTATASITVTCSPAIAMVKTATDGLGTEINTADVGDTITYAYDITNTGGVPLSNIILTDDHFPDSGNLCPADTTLAANDGVDGSGDDEIVCTAAYLVGETDTTDVDGLALTNTATVSGQPAVGEAVTATDDATVNINEVLTPCGFPVTFTFTDDIPFTKKGSDEVLFTLPAGLTLILQPGDQIKQGDEIIGCDQPFIIAGSPSGEPVLATGRMKIYLQQPTAGAAGLRALATDATLVVEVTEVTSWSVAKVPAPKPEVGTATATITVAGPALHVESGNAEAIIVVQPELEIPPTKKNYTISKPVPPTTGTGSSVIQPQRGMAGGLLTLLPLFGVVWVRRRTWRLD